MTEWISVQDHLPNRYSYEGYPPYIFAWDGKDILMCQWLEIDCDYDDKYESTNGWWFGYLDGTECYSAHENVTHWMFVPYPKPPQCKAALHE